MIEPSVDHAKIAEFMQRIIALNPVYVVNGKKENEFDCWKFFRLTQKELFGRDLPEMPIKDDKLSTFVRLAVEYKTKARWSTVEMPVHGCAVEMSHNIYPYHIGTWLAIQGGGVLHCIKGAGVCFSSMNDLKVTGWSRFVYDIPPQS